MKWSNTIQLQQPLPRRAPARRRRRRRTPNRAFAWREQAAYERGRRDGEKALSEQLLQQRGELLELQKGVLDSLAPGGAAGRPADRDRA